MEKLMIKCPECNHEFSPDQSLKHQLEHMLKAEKKQMALSYKEKESELLKKQEQLKKQETKIDELVGQKLATERSKLAQELESKVRQEVNTEVANLKMEVEEKQIKLNEAKKLELENERIKREANEREAEIKLQYEKTLTLERSKIENSIVDREAERHEMKLAERDKQLADLKKQLEVAQRKAEQGSQQLQGEVQETAIENLLITKFPCDEMTEVKKGINGADVLLQVVNSRGNECGMIAIESKRAKSWSDKWITKLKDDMKIHNANIGIIVTETLHPNINGFGLINGIWVCSYKDVEGLISVLRESLIQIFSAKQSQIGKGEKMELLYEYLCSTEFKHQIEGIVDGFSNMKLQLDKEKRAMKSIWAEREKQIDRIIDSTLNMYGSIKGIAGKNVIEIEQLELETGLLEEPDN